MFLFFFVASNKNGENFNGSGIFNEILTWSFGLFGSGKGFKAEPSLNIFNDLGLYKYFVNRF